MSKNESLNKSGPSEDENFVRSDNPGQTIWNKIDKSSKTREGKDKFRVYFCVFFIAIAKVYFLQERLATTLCLHPNFTFS